MNSRELERRFVSHTMNYGQMRKVSDMRARFITLAEEINRALPDGHEKSLALARLEECCFHTNAGIARSVEPGVMERISEEAMDAHLTARTAARCYFHEVGDLLARGKTVYQSQSKAPSGIPVPRFATKTPL